MTRCAWCDREVSGWANPYRTKDLVHCGGACWSNRAVYGAPRSQAFSPLLDQPRLRTLGKESWYGVRPL